jgi:hypothetical protein
MRVNRRRLIVALSGAALLSVAAYWLFWPISPQSGSSPSPDKLVSEPAKMDEVKTGDVKHAEAPQVPGNVEEPRASFRKFHRCYYASKALAASKNSVTQCKWFEGKPQYEKAYASCLNNLVDAQDRMSAAEAAMAGCGNDGDVRDNYYNATKSAAKAGDPDAQLCYLQSDFLDLAGKPNYTDAGVEEYKATAPQYVDDAFKRGDWRIVYLLTTQHFHPTSGYLNLLDNIGDPVTTYKMDKLLRLGSSGEYAGDLDALSDDLAHGPQLQGKVAEADAWARETYTQYFAGVPGITKPPAVCEPPVAQ